MAVKKIGIIGTGNRAGGICRYLSEIPGMHIYAMADTDQQRLENLALDYNVPAERRFTDYRKLTRVSDVDAVIVTTPDHTHYEVVMEAASQRKNIFCEKPMALTIPHCSDMLRICEENKLMFMMGFCLRYNHLYRTMKDMVSSGKIGRIHTVYAVDSVERGSAYFYHGWWRRKEKSGGLLLQKATHSLDIINWLVDDVPESVYAIGGLDVFGGKEPDDKRCVDCEIKKTCPEFIDESRHHGDYKSGKAFHIADKCVFAREVDIEDNEMLLVKYQNGTKLSFVENCFTPDYKREFTFIGDKGRLTAVDFYSHNGNPQNVKPYCEITVSLRHSNDIEKVHPELRAGGHGGGDPAMIEDFADALTSGREPVANGRTGLLSTAIAAFANDSIKSGQVEKIRF